MLSFFSSEMFPSIGFLSEWISLYPVFYTSSFAPCVRVLGGLKGEESRAKTREEEISHFTLLKLSFQKPAARCLQTARWGAGEAATLSGGTSWYLDAPQRALWHQPEPFTPKPAMPRRVIGIPEALCLVNPGFPRSEHVTTGGKQRTVLENGRFLKHVPRTASFAGE